MKRTKPEPRPDHEQVQDLLTKLRQLEQTELKEVNGAGPGGGRCAPGCQK